MRRITLTSAWIAKCCELCACGLHFELARRPADIGGLKAIVPILLQYLIVYLYAILLVGEAATGSSLPPT